MTYTILYSDKALKQLSKLSTIHSSRILEKIDSIGEVPHHYLEQCEGYPYYRQRIGDYRVIVDLDDRDRIIRILKVGLRKNVYER